jgi:peroxiredoxin
LEKGISAVSDLILIRPFLAAGAIVLFVTAVVWGLKAVPRKSRGQRRRLVLKAAAGLVGSAACATCYYVLLLFAMRQSPSPFGDAQKALFLLIEGNHGISMAAIAGSVGCAAYAILRRTGRQRWRLLLKSLFGPLCFAAGLLVHCVLLFHVLPALAPRPDYANRPGTLTRVGEPAPTFTVTTVDGNLLRSADLRGRVVLLNFFATWCGSCQKELPYLQTIWNEFRDDSDFQMIAVSREESNETIRAFKSEHGFTFPMAPDPDNSVYSQFASQFIPRTYLISRDGTIIYQCTGYHEEELSRLRTLVRKELARK